MDSHYHGGGFTVAEQFNLADHNNTQDMKVSVVKQVNGGAAPRQREERRVIYNIARNSEPRVRNRPQDLEF